MTVTRDTIAGTWRGNKELAWESLFRVIASIYLDVSTDLLSLWTDFTWRRTRFFWGAYRGAFGARKLMT